MRKSVRTILAFTFTTTVAFTTLGQAAPPGRSPYEIHPELTDTEETCRALGQIAYDQARARDSGMSYLRTLSIVRGLPHWSTMDTAVQTFVEANLRYIYERPSITPATTRNETEIMCLQSMERAHKAQPTLTKNRRY